MVYRSARLKRLFIRFFPPGTAVQHSGTAASVAACSISFATAPKRRTNFGLKLAKKPEHIVGDQHLLIGHMARANANQRYIHMLHTDSQINGQQLTTMENAPASRALAAFLMASFCFCSPGPIRPSTALAAWGVRPIWLITGMPRVVRNATVSPNAGPSSLTACSGFRDTAGGFKGFVGAAFIRAKRQINTTQARLLARTTAAPQVDHYFTDGQGIIKPVNHHAQTILTRRTSQYASKISLLPGRYRPLSRPAAYHPACMFSVVSASNGGAIWGRCVAGQT